MNLWKDGVEPGLRTAAAAVKAHGALALSQATCMGRRTNAHADLVGHGPSDTGSEVAPQIPHVLDASEIREIVADYAAAAARLATCGFDGVDLAYYDDQLPDQFWSRAINRRNDAYGGSLENRMRFSLRCSPPYAKPRRGISSSARASRGRPRALRPRTGRIA